LEGWRQIKPVSGLRDFAEEDVKPLKANRVGKRLDRLSKVREYSEVREEYNRLCEVLHPNMNQSLLLMRPHPEREGDVRFARDELVLERVLGMTIEPMGIAVEGTITSLNSINWPFGWQGRSSPETK
jgi:hypothetical protein